jgi:hypothetical protein
LVIRKPLPRRKKPSAGKPTRSDARAGAYESGATATLSPDKPSVKSTFPEQLQLVALRFGQTSGPRVVDVHMARGAGTKAAAYRCNPIVEFAQDLHDLQTGFRLDVMLFPVPVHNDHPRHLNSPLGSPEGGRR